MPSSFRQSRQRPSTTPVSSTYRKPTSIRVVRGPGASIESNRLSVLESELMRRNSSTERLSESDSVIIDEAIDSCPPSPPKRKVQETPEKEPPSPISSRHRRPNSSTPASRPTKRINIGRKELLGKGSFGMVYKAMDLDTNTFIAVKEIAIVAGNSGGIENIRREIKLMQRLDHPNIVRCLGEHLDADRFLRIYMEYVAGGTVSSILRSYGPMEEQQASRFTKQILSGLQYLHDRSIAHRDLKGENLLVDVNGTIKLADFGTAKELATEAKSVAGTAYFMAPEVIRGTGHGTTADIWSLGCCVIEMLTGRPPFHKLKNQYAIMMFVAERTEEVWDEVIPEKCTEEAKAFLKSCLYRKPAKRSTCSELLKMDWIVNPPAVSQSVSLHERDSPSEAEPESVHFSDSDTSVEASQDGAKSTHHKDEGADPAETSSRHDHKSEYESSHNPMQSFEDDL